MLMLLLLLLRLVLPLPLTHLLRRRLLLLLLSTILRWCAGASRGGGGGTAGPRVSGTRATWRAGGRSSRSSRRRSGSGRRWRWEPLRLMAPLRAPVMLQGASVALAGRHAGEEVPLLPSTPLRPGISRMRGSGSGGPSRRLM